MLERIKKTAKEIWFWTKVAAAIVATMALIGFFFWLDKLRFCI